MKDLHFEGLDLYKGDKLQGYIKKNEDPKNSQDKYIFWACPEHAKCIDEIDLHYATSYKTSYFRRLRGGMLKGDRVSLDSFDYIDTFSD